MRRPCVMENVQALIVVPGSTRGLVEGPGRIHMIVYNCLFNMHQSIVSIDFYWNTRNIKSFQCGPLIFVIKFFAVSNNADINTTLFGRNQGLHDRRIGDSITGQEDGFFGGLVKLHKPICWPVFRGVQYLRGETCTLWCLAGSSTSK